MIDVKNVYPTFSAHKYTVIRDCRNEKAPNDGYWYWGSYDNLTLAHEEANELCNGVLVESAEVNPVSFNNF